MSVQKGGTPGFSEGLEHTGVLSQLIQEAKKSKDNLTVVWMDLANASSALCWDTTTSPITSGE